MMYYPREKGMWDTWMFHYEGTFHLYYLQTIGQVGWKQIGHATSTDLLHWEEQEAALLQGKEDDWDAAPLGTGMVFRHNGKFYMTYCAFREGRPQKIGIATSDDLFNWTKHPKNPIIEPAMGGDIYETDPAENFENTVSWRDAFVRFDESDGMFHSFIAARTSCGPYVHRGCVAHAVSKDLINWDVLSPIYAPGKFHDYEIPELHKIDGKYYLISTNLFLYTNHYETPTRCGPSGEFYAVSEKPYEGFCEPADNLLVGNGNYRYDNCSVRVWQLDKEYMLHYQMVGGPVVDLVSLSAPKKLRTTDDGQLIAGYCSRLDGLKKKELISEIKSEWLASKKFLEGEKWTLSGDTLTAEVDGSFVLPTDVDVGNFLLECELMVEEGFFAGLGVAKKGPRISSIEAGALLDGQSQKVHILGRSFGKTGPVLKPLDSAGFPLRPGDFHHLRMMVRGPWTDVFFDDRLYFSLALPWPEEGVLVLLACDGKVRFRNLKLHEIG